MTWEPNETTQMVIDDYLKTMKEELPWLLQITEFIQGCTVEDLDPYSVGLATWPRLIRVKLRGDYNTDVWYREEMGLIVTDDVTVVRLREGEQYEIFRIGGSTGAGTGGVVYANPTASVGLAPVNGVLATAMRSDGAPQLSQAIAPTWTGVHTHAQDVIMDDGVLNSPLLRFVGGSNDDEAFLYLQDDIILNASDLVISLVDTLGDSLLKINDSGGNAVITFDSNGGAVFNERNEDADFRIEGVGEVNAFFVQGSDGHVGIGTNTIPHGGVGAAMFAMEGANGSIASGPHIQHTTAADDYPLFHQLNFSHDNIALSFDTYFADNWRSSDAGSNFQIYKVGDDLDFRYASGFAQGSLITWATAITIANDGKVGIGTGAPGVLLDVQGPAIFNEAGIDADFRIEGDSEQHLFFVDAGNDKVGIRNSTPYGIFHVGTPLLVTTGTFEFLISDPSPQFGWEETDGAVDNRLWDFLVDVERFQARVVNDANTVATTWVQVERTGTVIDSVAFVNSNVSVGIATPAARLHVDQGSTSGSIPVLFLDQADLSEEFIEFASTIGAGYPIDTAAIGTYYGKIRVMVNGVGYKYMALYNS